MNEAAVATRDLLNLAGQRVLVTGASGNIGSCIAKRLAEAGAALVLHYGRAAEDAERLAAEIELLGGAATVLQADLRDEQQINELFDQLDGSPLTAVVNNAAAQPVTALSEMTLAEWSDVMAANLHGAFQVSQSAARMFAGHGGAIVNIASIEGSDPAAGHAHYSAGKAALLMLTRSLALEYGRAGVRANAVSPGLIDRDGLSEEWPEGVARWQARVPLSRVGNALDVADAVLFLLSPAARWISGANLLVDGGMSAVSRW